MNFLHFISDDLGGFIWGRFGIAALLGTGILMTVLLKFFQVAHIGHWMRSTLFKLFDKSTSQKKGDSQSISQFQALCASLAATIGTGNIAGVASAVALGGPGAVFWMWVSAFFGMMTAYAENALGIYYRQKDKKGEWSGGAMYYLQHGLGGKKGLIGLGRVLAILFAAFSVLASFGIGNLAQTNTISQGLKSTFGIPMWITGVAVTAITAAVILGGLKSVASVTERLVPFMAAMYIFGTVAVIFINLNMLLPSLSSVFRFAFTARAGVGGAAGVGVAYTVSIGFRRGVFSNEAGLGSSVTVNATSDAKEPAVQGMWGIFEVFFDTVVVCTLTALCILTSGLVNLETGYINRFSEGLDGGTLAAQAFGCSFGKFGAYFIAVSVLLFALATVIGWSYYGTKSFTYLFGEKSAPIYKILFVAVAFVSSIITDVSLAWEISDTFNGLMMIPNLIGVLALTGTVMRITKNYTDRKFRGVDVRPVLSHHKDIQYQHEAELLLEQ